MTRRPTTSMRIRFYRWLSHGSEQLGESRAQLVELAIENLMSELGVLEPGPDWEPTKGEGRPAKRLDPEMAGGIFNF